MFSGKNPSITGQHLFSLHSVRNCECISHCCCLTFSFLTWSKTNSMNGDKQKPLSQHCGGSQNHSLSLYCKDKPHFIYGIGWGKPSSTVKRCIFLLLSLLPNFHWCLIFSFLSYSFREVLKNHDEIGFFSDQNYVSWYHGNVSIKCFDEFDMQLLIFMSKCKIWKH